MRKLKVLLDFVKLSVPAKIAFGRMVVQMMTDNPLFEHPDVTLVVLLAAVDKLEAAYLETKDGSRVAIAKMHDAESEFDDLFRVEAAYVDRTAGGSESAIKSSGFNVSKQPTPPQKPDLAVQDGDNSGSVWLVARAVDKAGAYIWQFAKDALPDTEEGWSNGGTTVQSYFQLTGLTVATKYYFRVCAITRTGNTDYTAPVLKIVI